MLLVIPDVEGVAGIAPSLVAASSVPVGPVVLAAVSDVWSVPPAVVPVVAPVVPVVPVAPVAPGVVPGVGPDESGK